MRIFSCVIEDLRSQFNHAEVSLWLIIYDSSPSAITSLASQVRASRKFAYSTCKKMAAAGWLRLQEEGIRLRPIATIPHATQHKMVRVFHEEYEAAPLKAEFLMKAVLDFLILSRDYTDNARLRGMRNDRTGEPLEIDRYYHGKAGLECQGTQHLGPTEKYPDGANERETRDTLKVWLSWSQGIELVRIYVADLHPIMMARLIPGCLTRRHIDEDGPYYKALCSLCEAYINKATGVSVQKYIDAKKARAQQGKPKA